MPQTSRELVRNCVKFDSPERIPRDLWVLPWASQHFPEEVMQLQTRFPSDFTKPAEVYSPSAVVEGGRYTAGRHVDEWGCVFTNLQDGYIGEVRSPIVKEMADWQQVKPPYNVLPADEELAREKVNRSCHETDLFVLASACPRPWERYQFLRGVENAMLDVLEPEGGFLDLLKRIHEFYLAEIEFWVSTDVDGIMFMDDWGSQSNLLISPHDWRAFFKSLYRDYCDLTHSHNKLAFMHSDGQISSIYEDLIEVGVDAINSQLFCMNMKDLAERAKRKITFWGEIDRQHILTSPDPQEGRDAVRKVAEHLFDPAGGIIAQFELGLGANPATAMAIFEEWEKID
ncbi:methyltransferase [bacterium]|nr:methyltransferase [bacterium]